MRMSSFLMAATFAASLAACTSPMTANFSGIPPMPEQQQAQNPADPTLQKLALFPADPQVQMHLNQAQTSPYDSPDFVVPPYEIEP